MVVVVVAMVAGWCRQIKHCFILTCPPFPVTPDARRRSHRNHCKMDWTRAVGRDLLLAFRTILCQRSSLRRPLFANLDGKGRPILFVHGSSGNQSDWLQAWDPLTTKFRDHPCWAFSLDYRFDEATKEQGWDSKMTSTRCRANMIDRSVTDYAKELLRRIDFVSRTHNVDSVFVFGHSMGGLVACEAMRLAPEKISSVVAFASPLMGAPLLKIAALRAICNTKRHRDMTPGSDLLTRFEGNHQLPKKLLAIASWNDLQVPPHSARLSGCRTIVTGGFGHASLIQDTSVFGEIETWMKERP